MRIIDAHVHFSRCDSFDRIAAAAGHENTPSHLAEAFRENHIVLGIAMGEMGGERIDGVCTPRTPEMLDAAAALPPAERPPTAWCAGVESGEIAPETL